MRMLISCVAAAVLVATPVVSVADEAAFKTPEDAIGAYLDGVTRQDFQKILAATAVDEMSKGFDFTAYVHRAGALNSLAPAPAVSPFLSDLDRTEFSAHIEKQVQFLIYGLMTGGALVSGQTVVMDDSAAKIFLARIDPRRLSGIVVERIGTPYPALLNTSKNLSNQVAMAHMYGADDATERVVLFSFEQGDYVMGFTLLRYGQDWKVYDQSAPLAGTSMLGAPAAITVQAFDDLTK